MTWTDTEFLAGDLVEFTPDTLPGVKLDPLGFGHVIGMEASGEHYEVYWAGTADTRWIRSEYMTLLKKDNMPEKVS